MVKVTIEHIRAAKAAGACDAASERLVGRDFASLNSNLLAWIEGRAPKLAASISRSSAASADVLAEILVRLIGCDGDGDGDGYGDGDGNGNGIGYGDGNGYGYGYCYGDGIGNGDGYCYGDGYGIGDEP